MPAFAERFWSPDLNSGLDALFKAMHNGCMQCELFIQVFASRMQCEVECGRRLCAIRGEIDGLVEANRRLTGSTIQDALNGLVESNAQEGEQHLAMAGNIETLVLQPFSKWCEEHRERIKYSEGILRKNAANFAKSRKFISKLEADYAARYRSLEEFKSANFTEDELTRALDVLKLQEDYETLVARERDNQTFGVLGSIELDHKSMREILNLLLTKLPKREYKLPFISYTLKNTNNGSEITNFLLENMSLKDFDQAESFGQDLLNLGFIKYCNGVGTTFVNSKKFQYQWKSYAYQFSNVSIPEDDLTGSYEIKELSSSSESSVPEMKDPGSTLGSYLEPNLSGYLYDLTSKVSQRIPSSQDISEVPESILAQSPNITEEQKTLFRLMDECKRMDAKYYKECFKMDALRCSIEELTVDHFSFLEKCEIDRLKAIKKATLDFCSTLGNKISSLKICVEKMVSQENSMDTAADLLNLVSLYGTGVFQPKPIIYNNYYNPGAYQNFGIALETRCKLDKKVVPLIISSILSYMDQLYPDMADDKERTSAWISPVKLNLTHQLRAMLNKKQFHSEIEVSEILKSSNADPGCIASVVKIYLLELPEPLIPSDCSEILKRLYNRYGVTESWRSKTLSQEETDESIENDRIRITGICKTLSTLRKPNLATLDALFTHFDRLINIVKMGESEGEQLAREFTYSISQEFANCLIQAHVAENNELGFKLFYDLLLHKNHVFQELKRSGLSKKK